MEIKSLDSDSDLPVSLRYSLSGGGYLDSFSLRKVSEKQLIHDFSMILSSLSEL